MFFHTMLKLGFLGLSWSGFSGGLPIPIGTGVGAPTYGDFSSPVVQLPPAKTHAPAAPQGINFPNFKAIEFPFVTTVQDDGTGKAGGYQVAKVNLEFIKITIPVRLTKWYCPFTIQMPLRTEFMGKVDAIRAATLSATVANSVAAGMDDKLPQGIFCHRFMEGMRGAFATMYPFLGAAVIK